MASDPLVRKIVLDEARRNGGQLEGDTIADIRRKTGLGEFSNKQVRRAIESLCYGHREVDLERPRLDEFSRGWKVSL